MSNSGVPSPFIYGALSIKKWLLSTASALGPLSSGLACQCSSVEDRGGHEETYSCYPGQTKSREADLLPWVLLELCPGLGWV